LVFWNVAVMKNRKYLNLTRQWSRRPEGTRPADDLLAGNGNYIRA